MSELLGEAGRRKELLKHMILQLHKGVAPEQVRKQLVRLLGQVPYNEVVEVEQQLINEGLPVEEILRLCDLHAAALEGAVTQKGAKTPPKGHPVHTFKQENKALSWEIRGLRELYAQVREMDEEDDATEAALEIRRHFNRLMDVDRHYLRKEHLLFPFLERHGIDGPPKVMWGKHDEARALLKQAMEALEAIQDAGKVSAGELASVTELALKPASDAIAAMIDREEEILFPMCLDVLTDEQWYEIYKGSDEIGYCLYDPVDEWKPQGVETREKEEIDQGGRIRLRTGSFTVDELVAILNTIPFDLTFVDKDDTVRYYTEGKERIFARTRAVLGRKVQYCHPPSSVHVVNRILDAFKAGEQDMARFWIQSKGRFICIEYFALRNEQGEYLGCLEVSQDLTAKRALQGERRILQWDGDQAAGTEAKDG